MIKRTGAGNCLVSQKSFQSCGPVSPYLSLFQAITVETKTDPIEVDLTNSFGNPLASIVA